MKRFHHTQLTMEKKSYSTHRLLRTSRVIICGILLGSAHLTFADAMDMTPSLLTQFDMDESPLSLSAGAAPFEISPPPISLAAYAREGWQATLSTRAHGVRGTVTIVDADTFRVDNFFYDGGGINVHFILASADDNNIFRTTRLVTDLNLLGTAHNGDSITIDLPTGTTFDGYNAISLWCLPAGANFGSGTFVNTVPEPSSGLLFGLGVTVLGIARRRREGQTQQPGV